MLLKKTKKSKFITENSDDDSDEQNSSKENLV